MKTIYVDADACNLKTRTIILNFAHTHCKIVLVSDRKIPLHTSHKTVHTINSGQSIQQVVVPQSENAADAYIIKHICAGDVLFTRDLQLAKQVLIKKAVVLSDYAEEYTLNNIDARIIRSQAQASVRTLVSFQNDITVKGKSKKSKTKKSKKQSQEIANFLQKWLKSK